MRRDDRVHVLLGDLGYGMFDSIKVEFPARCTNVGAAEQLLIGAAVGMAEAGLVPVAYSITPFLLWRAAEWIRNYLDHERVPVRLLGAGRDRCYAEDGFTHYAGDDKAFLSLFPNVKGFWPEDEAALPGVLDQWLYHDGPSYLNLKR